MSQHLWLAAIRHTHQVDARHRLKQFASSMGAATDAAVRHVDLARIGPRIGDKLGYRLGWKQRIHHDDRRGIAVEAAKGRNIGDEIEIEIFIKRCIPRVCRTDHDKRVAVRLRLGDRLDGEIAASAGPVLDDELLPHSLRQPLTYQARDNVSRTAGGSANNQMYRARRIGLRPREARDFRERGRARCEMEKISAGKFHFEPPSHHSITSLASASSRSGKSRPSDLAVFRLTRNSYFVGCCTGKSPGFSPRRMRST